ncbi:L-methionine/branched-chain amino acid exporter YjeH [compost metagenome]
MAVLSFDAYGDAQRNATSLPWLLENLLGPQAKVLVAVVGYLACFASMNVYVQGFARLIWSLADEGKLPASLARRNRQGMPGPALLLVVLACALCAVGAAVLQLSTDELIRYANGNFVLVYLLSMAAGAVLLRGPWRIVAAVACLLCALVLAMLGWDALYALGLLALLALLDVGRRRRTALA